MAELNIQLNDDLERKLAHFMRLHHLRSRAKAILRVVEEIVERELARPPAPDFASWLGMGLRAPLNPRPRFHTDGDLWR